MINSVFQPRKRFGQHFLHDTLIIDKIIKTISPQKKETIVEIGPGKGALTIPLAKLAIKLHAIELDNDLSVMLKKRFRNNSIVKIIQADALDFNFSALGNNLRIIGNLPYNISTPLMFKLTKYRDHIKDQHFMLQKEVVDRLIAKPGNKNYGRLTVMLGTYLDITSLFEVQPNAFKPPPKVNSAVVRMTSKPLNQIIIKDLKKLSSIVTLAFSQRRKMLSNALKNEVLASDMEAVGIDPKLRAEQVPIKSWSFLANHLTNQKTY